MTWDIRQQLDAFSRSPGQWSLGAARRYCRWVANTHYENFSVASLFLPRRLLPHFHAVYAYCRWADDLADETGPDAPRLLGWWRESLLACYAVETLASGASERPGGPLESTTGAFTRPARPQTGAAFGPARLPPSHPVFVALRPTIQRFSIPSQPFLDLLSAFEQDQYVKEYDNYTQLRDYCRRSADPVGRLVLYLFECHDSQNATRSDSICTALQEANFWQDVARDRAVGRVYLPREDRERFGVSDDNLTSGQVTPAFRELLRFEVARTRLGFDAGEPLVSRVPDEFRPELELFIAGGRAILDRIASCSYDVLTARPALSKVEKAKLVLAAPGCKAARMMGIHS